MCRVLGDHSASAAGGWPGGMAPAVSTGGQHPWVLTQVLCLAMCAQCKCVHDWKCVHMCNCVHTCKRVRGRGCASIRVQGVHGHACTLGHTQRVGLRACTACVWAQLAHLRAGYRQVPKCLCGGARCVFRLPEHTSTDTSLGFGSCSTTILAWCCGGRERGTVRGRLGSLRLLPLLVSLCLLLIHAFA